MYVRLSFRNVFSKVKFEYNYESALKTSYTLLNFLCFLKSFMGEKIFLKENILLLTRAELLYLISLTFCVFKRISMLNVSEYLIKFEYTAFNLDVINNPT